MKSLPLLLVLLLHAWSAAAPAAVIMTQPQRYYFQTSDSPYYPLFPTHGYEMARAYYYAFENGAEKPVDLEWEGAYIRNTGSPTYGSENASVDGDDGRVDGFDREKNGITGTGYVDEPTLDFYFTTTQHQSYPVWFGMVITTPGGEFEGGPTIPLVELLGIGGTVLARISLYDVMQDMWQALQHGEDAEFYRVRDDRVVYFHSDEQITRVKIYNPVTFDHVQFGYDRVYVPESGSAALAGLAALALLGQRRRRCC